MTFISCTTTTIEEQTSFGLKGILEASITENSLGEGED